MRSHVRKRFRRAYAALPEEIQRQARGLRTLQGEPVPSPPTLPARASDSTDLSPRISLGYRALGTRDGDDIVWFWIGSHADYDLVLARR